MDSASRDRQGAVVPPRAVRPLPDGRGSAWVAAEGRAVIVIYAVEGNPADQQRALDHLAALEGAGHRFAISELTRTECLVPVFGLGGGEAVGLLPVLPRAEPADAGPDGRNA